MVVALFGITAIAMLTPSEVKTSRILRRQPEPCVNIAFRMGSKEPGYMFCTLKGELDLWWVIQIVCETEGDFGNPFVIWIDGSDRKSSEDLRRAQS